MDDPTIPAPGPPGDVPDAPQRVSMSSRVELVAALLTAVVGIELLGVIVGLFGGGAYRSVGDRIGILSLNLDVKTGLVLLVAAMLATLRDITTADFDTPRTDLGRRTLFAVAAFGVAIAILSLIGIGLDLSRAEYGVFGTNSGAAVLHRLAVVLMASTAAGWALTALGVRITTTPRS